MSGSNGNITKGGGGGGPCGACKFLRRKCVKGCLFAPYFDSEQGTAHFAAVHKVFGASNASKLLLRVPVHERLDTVVSLCYEALARARDPVYGCVAHIFALQQQIVNLQAELAYIQARVTTLQHLPLPIPLQPSSSELVSSNPEPPMNFNCDMSMRLDQQSSELTSSPCHLLANDDHQELDVGELHALAREFVSRYLPGVRFKHE